MTRRESSRHRMLAALRREEHRGVPFSPYIGNQARFDPPFAWDNQIERAQRMLEVGADPCIDIWLPPPIPSADVEIHATRERRSEETILTKEYRTPAGVLRQVVRETDDWCAPRHGPWIPTIWGIERRTHCNVELFDDYNVSRRIEPWVKDSSDLAKLRSLILPPEGHLLDEWRMDARRAMEYARRLDVLTVCRRTFAGDAFQWLCDIPWFLMQLVSDPAFVTEFFAIFQEWNRRMIELALEVGVDVVQYWDWYEISTYWGPRYWQRYLRPLIAEQAALAHQAGMLFSYLLPEGHGAYADGLAGLDGLDVCQGVDPRMLHGGDLGSLYHTLGGSSAFWGGINAEVTLQSQDEDMIERELRETVEILNAGNGLILSAFLFQEVPAPAVDSLIRAWKAVDADG